MYPCDSANRAKVATWQNPTSKLVSVTFTSDVGAGNDAEFSAFHLESRENKMFWDRSAIVVAVVSHC